MTNGAAPGPQAIPDSHRDLLSRPIPGVFTTIGADGQPESSLVWVDIVDGWPAINATLERLERRNIVANPRVSLLVVDPENSSRFIQVRGDAELVFDGAVDHLDALTRRYTAHPHDDGFFSRQLREPGETRVTCRIRPRRITLDAIHA